MPQHLSEDTLLEEALVAKNGTRVVEVVMIEEARRTDLSLPKNQNRPQLDLIVMLLQVRKDNVQIIASYS